MKVSFIPKEKLKKYKVNNLLNPECKYLKIIIL